MAMPPWMKIFVASGRECISVRDRPDACFVAELLFDQGMC